MGRAPCCDKASVKKGPWSPDEDETLRNFILTYGTGGNWIALPKKAGLRRCGKSCRLRWLNYLRPDIRHGSFTEDEDAVICSLYNEIGSRWSFIASHLKGRTDNDVKNYWNTRLKKKLLLSEKPIDDNLQKTGSITNADFDFPLPACTGFSTHDDMLAIMTAPITEHSTMYNVAGTFVPELLPSTNTTCSSSNSSTSTNASSSVSSLVKEEKDWNGGGGVVQGNGSLLDFGFGFAGDDGMAAGVGGDVWYQDGSMNYFNYNCSEGVD